MMFMHQKLFTFPINLFLSEKKTKQETLIEYAFRIFKSEKISIVLTQLRKNNKVTSLNTFSTFHSLLNSLEITHTQTGKYIRPD